MATPELSMILSIPELRLSLNMLEYTHWHDLPLIDTDESVEQRLMNAFLHLVQTGHLMNAEGGYRMAPGFEQLMTNIGQADNVYHLCKEQRIVAFFYEKDGKTVPVMGLPGCVMYAKRTIFDLVLPRVIADDPVTKEELASLGEGGLCLGCDICTFPNCGFGKGK